LKLQNERSSGADTSATRKKVTSHDGFENGGLARGLRANHDYLGQLDALQTDGVEHVLQLVDYWNKRLHRWQDSRRMAEQNIFSEVTGPTDEAVQSRR